MNRPNQLLKLHTFPTCALLLALGTVGCVFTGCSKEPAEKEPVVSVQAAAVQRAAISETIAAEAVLYPLDQASLASKVTAPIREFLVNRGDRVRRGQLLAILENRDLSAAAMESQGAYEQAQANYDIAKGATLPEEIQKAELDAKTAKDALDAQQKVYDSRKVLFNQGALPRKDLDQAFVTLTQLRAQFEIAEKHLAGLQKISQKQELKAATAQLDSARGHYLGAEAQLSYSRILSPIDGVVTDRPVYPGDTVTAGTPFMTVMNTAKVIAKAHIAESAAAQLKKGDSATLTVERKSPPIPAQVILVSPAVDPNSTTVEVWVEAANPKGELKPGISVQVSMVARTVSDALVIPASAVLQKPDGESVVLVVGNDGRAHERAVQIGIRNPDLVQVTSGLKVGDQVIQSGNFGLPDNTKIRVEKPGLAEKES